MNFKIPVIISSIIFVLIFLINLIIRNSFLVVITRSLISAIIGFGISFGIIFLFKNVLNVEWSNDISDLTSETPTNTTNSSSVDIMAGEDANDEVLDFNKSVDSINSDEEEVGELETIDEDSSFSNDIQTSAEIDDDMEVEDLQFVEDAEELPSIEGAGDSSFIDDDLNTQESNMTSLKDTGISSDEFVDIMREKIGQDATSKETAKAIRTMMNKDK